MKRMFIPLLVIVCFSAYSQKDSVRYLNGEFRPTSKDSATYYSVLHFANPLYRFDFFKAEDNKLFMSSAFSQSPFNQKAMVLPTGYTVHYYDNGVVKDSTLLDNGKKTSSYYFYENGNKRATITYENGKVIQQIGWDESGNAVPDLIVEQEAKFPGGTEGWRKYLERHLDANVAERAGAPVGLYTVKVQFIVDKDGSLSDVKALTVPPNCAACADEAVRVIRKGPKWVPAIEFGKPALYQAIQFLTFQVSPR
jgi:hypothetical protein